MEKRIAPRHLSWAIAICAALLQQVAGAATGRTQGQFSVSPFGAATYTVPIWAAPGPNGLQPHIALTYNSQEGNGYLGVGWKLSGLGTIARCNLTVAQDGAPAAVSLTVSDALCIDGKRLRLTSGSQGVAGSTYQTEIADFSNVTAVGTAGNGPASFVVKRRDGLIYEYGNGGNSQVLAAGTSTALAWMLDKVTDRAGNALIVNYLTDPSMPGTVIPSTISWTPIGAGATVYSYTMTFGYGTLPAAAATYQYVAGTQIINNRFLQTISISHGSLIKEYFLGYLPSSQTGRYQLKSIQECADSAQANCLSATNIDYQGSAAGAGLGAAHNLGIQTTNQSNVITGYDLNGDGINDLALWVAGTWWVAFGSSSGIATPISTGLSDPNALATIGNVDISGKAGFLIPNGSTWWYYKWNGTAFAGSTAGLAVDSYTASHNSTALLADVNGDGRADLVYLSADNFIRVALNTTTVSGSPTFSAPFDTVDYTQFGVSVLYTQPTLDYYGAGQQDVLAQIPFDNGGVALLHFAGNTLSIGQLTDTPIPVAIDVGDYNDDGCADVLTRTELILSNCSGKSSVGFISFGDDTAITGIDWDGSGPPRRVGQSCRHAGDL
jgi:hypothetical protein